MSGIVIGLIVGVIAGAIGVALDTHRKRRLGIKDEPIVPKAKKYKADWVHIFPGMMLVYAGRW